MHIIRILVLTDQDIWLKEQNVENSYIYICTLTVPEMGQYRKYVQSSLPKLVHDIIDNFTHNTARATCIPTVCFGISKYT
jgi:hypothetical protein